MLVLFRPPAHKESKKAFPLCSCNYFDPLSIVKLLLAQCFLADLLNSAEVSGTE